MLLPFYLPWLTVGASLLAVLQKAWWVAGISKTSCQKLMSLLGDPSVALLWPQSLIDQNIVLLIW